MNTCKIVCSSAFSLQGKRRTHRWSSSCFQNSPKRSARFSGLWCSTRISRNQGSSRSYTCMNGAVCGETEDYFNMTDQVLKMEDSSCELDRSITIAESRELPLESLSTSTQSVEELLEKSDDVRRLMKMERISDINNDGSMFFSTQSEGHIIRRHWFPYLDLFRSENMSLSSNEVIRALDPHILEVRKERMRAVVKNRSYSICLVVEGLTDFGNVSAAFRSADALGFQSVHVVSCDSSKRYRANRHVSMGAEKWLDIELWKSTQECFNVLKARGYRIATTHVGIGAVSIYDMDWTIPTAIVLGNEHGGTSEKALELSDLHCCIPMKGMVDSFNVSVAAGILMHHAVRDRISRLGCHGDLTHEERQILLAEFSLRHSKSAVSIAHEHAKRKQYKAMPKL